MRLPVFFLMSSLILAACSSEPEESAVASAPVANAPQPIKCEIDSNSIAGLPLGTTIAQVRTLFPRAVITPLKDAEGVDFFNIKITPEIEIFAYTNDATDAASAAAEQQAISYLDTASRTCKTAQGVHPYMLLSDAEQIYGAVQQIVMSEVEARQTAEFDTQPPELSFRIDDSGAFDSTDTDLPKITTDYQEGAKIHSIAVMNLPSEETTQ